MNPKPVNPYGIHIALIESTYLYDVLAGVLHSHQAAINEAERIFQEAQKLGDEDYTQVVADEQSDLVENLVGCSFVACQAYITAVVSRIISLHTRAARSQIVLNSTNGSRADIIHSGCAAIAATAVTTVEAMNALANYYKHNDEWGPDWTKATDQMATTLSFLQPLGLVSGSTGNLRTGLVALGNDLLALPEVLRLWQMQLKDVYESELKARGLL